MVKTDMRVLFLVVMLTSSSVCSAAEIGDVENPHADISALFESIKRLRQEEEKAIEGLSSDLYALAVPAGHASKSKQGVLDSFLLWQHMRQRNNAQVDAVEKIFNERYASRLSMAGAKKRRRSDGDI